MLRYGFVGQCSLWPPPRLYHTTSFPNTFTPSPNTIPHTPKTTSHPSSNNISNNTINPSNSTFNPSNNTFNPSTTSTLTSNYTNNTKTYPERNNSEDLMKLRIQELQRSYYIKNKEAIRKQHKLYYHKNKEVIQKQKQEYRATHKEAARELGKRYRLRSKEAIKVKNKMYRLENRQAIQDWQARYRVHHKEALKAHMRAYYLANKEKIKEKKRLHRLRHPRVRKYKTWKVAEDVRRFLEGVKEKLCVSEVRDWYRISREQMYEVGGGRLYSAFGNLGKALEFAFPEVEWDKEKFSFRGKKSTQRWLCVILEQILPSKTDIVEDFLHPDLLWDEATNHKMELDIWVPEYQLALEYQGEHHYHDLHTVYGPNGTVALYSERDLKKKTTCLEKGITLVTIPYWWDGKKESLSSTLHQVLPDLFPSTDAPSIPVLPPKKDAYEPELLNQEVASLLMHGHVWNGEQDPTGWLISEKLDGFRAFWDGHKLFTKYGNSYYVPLDFTQSFPDVCLDGELWIGYDDFNKLSSICRRNDSSMNNNQLSELWKDVKFCVFDAPMHEGDYLERHSFASKSISECGPNICMIPIEQCLGLDHLQTILNQITTKKGEGVMLYHPTSKYTSGRTHNLLKVKAYREEDVQFLEINPNSYSFLCEQKNGAKCVVKCSGWDYMFPPSPGTVLTVKHNGFFNVSQKMKYPFLFRIRTDLNWSLNTKNDL